MGIDGLGRIGRKQRRSLTISMTVISSGMQFLAGIFPNIRIKLKRYPFQILRGSAAPMPPAAFARSIRWRSEPALIPTNHFSCNVACIHRRSKISGTDMDGIFPFIYSHFGCILHIAQTFPASNFQGNGLGNPSGSSPARPLLISRLSFYSVCGARW